MSNCKIIIKKDSGEINGELSKYTVQPTAVDEINTYFIEGDGFVLDVTQLQNVTLEEVDANQQVLRKFTKGYSVESSGLPLRIHIKFSAFLEE